MRRLDLAPTVDQLNLRRTTDFLSTVYDRFNLYTGTTNPTVNDVPAGQWVLFKNTTTGEVRLWTNDNGTLKSTVLTKPVPAFSAYQNVAQTILNNTFTKITFQVEDYDRTSNFDLANGRFQPNVSGIYSLGGAVSYAGVVGAGVTLFKNGSEIRRGNLVWSTGSSGTVTASADLFLNGTTDYVELFTYQASGATQNTSPATSGLNGGGIYFNGHFVCP